MKIYFGGALRASSQDWHTYGQLIQHLKEKGTVLTEHFATGAYAISMNSLMSDPELFNNYMELLNSSDMVVCEVSTPSLGVGFEIAKAQELHKPILCLYRSQSAKKLSVLVSGNAYVTTKTYRTAEDAYTHIDAFFAEQQKHTNK
jgi:2'-deoxynucleoside 5'-phosphate N-hydrolase